MVSTPLRVLVYFWGYNKYTSILATTCSRVLLSENKKTVSRVCTWFWLRLSSIAWHVLTDPGISVILFLDKFTASRFLRVLIASGKWVSLFSDTFRVRKFDNCDIESGSLVNRFPSKDKCSSPFRFPISFGMISEKKQNNKALYTD